MIRVAAGTTLTGEAEYMSIVNQPAVGEVLFNNESRTIQLRFEPPSGAPRGRTFVAHFNWSLDVGVDATAMVGRTTP